MSGDLPISHDMTPMPPRRGIVPFPADRQITLASDGSLTSEQISAGPIGKTFFLELSQPLGDHRLKIEYDPDSNGITFDASGKVVIQRARDLLEKGYLLVSGGVTPHGKPNTENVQDKIERSRQYRKKSMKAELWLDIEGSETVKNRIGLVNPDTNIAIISNNQWEPNTGEGTKYLFLPNDPDVLKKVRVAFEGTIA